MTKNKIWVINHHAGHPSENIGTRHWALSQFLGKEGIQVDIFAASTLHPSGKQRSEKGFVMNFGESGGHVKIHTIWTPNYKSQFGRVVNMFVFGVALVSKLAVKRIAKPDLIIGSSVTPIAAFAAFVLAKIHRCKFIYEIRDLWPETFVRFEKVSKNSFLCKVLYLLEEYTWRNAYLIISPLKNLSDYGEDRGYPQKEIIHIPNGVDIKNYSFCARNRQSRISLIYAGSLGEMYNLVPLVRALNYPELEFLRDQIQLTVITGISLQRVELESFAKQNSFNRVLFKERVDKETLQKFLETADALILPLNYSNGLYEYGASPNKVAEYMAAGKIVLQSCSYPGAPVMDDITGIVIEQNQEDLWVEALVRLVNISQDHFKEMSKAAREKAEAEFDFHILGEIFKAVVLRTLSQPDGHKV